MSGVIALNMGVPVRYSTKVYERLVAVVPFFELLLEVQRDGRTKRPHTSTSVTIETATDLSVYAYHAVRRS